MRLTKAQSAVLATIKGDEEFLRWARYSIRFNSKREDQAIDFLFKLRWNRRDIEGSNIKTISAALAEISKEDRGQ